MATRKKDPEETTKETTTCTPSENTQETKSPEEAFYEEASNIPVPTSVAMNNFRQTINTAISESQLHVECILEVLRSACTAVEQAAAATADKEAGEYYTAINNLREKYGIADN